MNPRRKIRSSPDQPGLSREAQGGLIVAALVLIPLLAIGGGDTLRTFLDFGSGVLSLVSLSASVAWGLLATDRIFLSVRQRLIAQAIHRTTATASIGFLLLHVSVKVSLGHVELLGALVPFGLGLTGTSVLIGFGSLAGFLMVIAGATGAARSALAGNNSLANSWRALHMLAYPAWCAALIHGLFAGRPAAAWVTTLYSLSLAGAAVAVSLRLLPPHVKRQVVERLLSLTGRNVETPTEESKQSRRNLSTAPLPGTSGMSAPPEYERDFPRSPADRDEPLGRPLGQPLGPPLGSTLGVSRSEPPRLAAPSPQLYEASQVYPSAQEASASEPATAEGAFPGSGSFSEGPLPGDGPGTGISAAYRAVSMAGDASTRPTGSPTSSGVPSDGIPLAERVPLTEELPIIAEDPAPRSGLWPTPSPPPPAQAIPSQPVSSPYETGPTSSYASYGTPYDQGSAYGTSGGYDAQTPTTAYPGPLDETQAHPGPLDETQAFPGPLDDTQSGTLYPPRAGEPWHAPAGERP
ncbi:hypothetical protein [Streptomyces sp. NPDC059175]|uniref:hypothetical protein n=1 Tax=unclassified Streptomyces TaxID=2593676 RepID=UPI003694BC0C